MAAQKTSKKPSKSDFIRQQPAEMSVADVIAAGKAAGIKFTSSLVYMVRGRQDGKDSPKKAPAKKTSAKAAAAKTSAKKVSAAKKKATPKKTATASKTTAPKRTGESKADFVRQNAALNPKEIVAKATAEGVKLDIGYVYAVRAEQRKSFRKEARAKAEAETSKAPKRVASTSSKPTTSNGSRPSGSSVEDLLRAAAAELGLGRALEILQGERARVRAVLGDRREARTLL